MTVIVDSNILISALINSRGSEFSILKNNYREIDFATTYQQQEEVSKKISSIASFTNNSPSDIFYQYQQLISQFLFLDVKDIHKETITQTEKLMRGLDLNDFLFVATTIYFEGLLWTGDVKLKKGLNRKGFYHVITTSELKQIIKGL